MSPRRFAAARFLIRRYPRRWQERYADEVLALLEDTGVTVGGLADLARGAMAELVRARFEGAFGRWASRAERYFFGTGRLLLWASVATNLWLVAGLVGDRLHEAGLAVPAWSSVIVVGLVIASALRVAYVKRDMLWYRGRPATTPTPGIGYVEAGCLLTTIPLLRFQAALVGPEVDPARGLGIWLFLLVASLNDVTRRTPADISVFQQSLIRLGPIRRSVLGLSERDPSAGEHGR